MDSELNISTKAIGKIYFARKEIGNLQIYANTCFKCFPEESRRIISFYDSFGCVQSFQTGNKKTRSVINR